MSTRSKYRAPFPYFGGKSKVADIVWQSLGDPEHYIEPFFGSGAVLLSRKNWYGKIETVNDKDGYIANVWRSLQFAPDEVARWCDWPVNHADLSARKKTLVKNESRLLENLIADEKWYDAVMAGYWIWAASCWIGSGLTSIGKRPHVSNSGTGIHAIGKRPHVSTGGKGVQEPYNTNIYTWFRELSERLRYVRVVCGDWTRVCGGNWQINCGVCGIFFDPPYGVKDRDTDLYHIDSTTVAEDVMAWCAERGKRETYRIVIAGYEEYEPLLKNGWRYIQWSSKGGYSNLGNGRRKINRHRERLYFSPHCIQSGNELFL
jgi:DNA adenine methylase